MIFEHRDGTDSAATMSFGIRDEVPIENGTFEVSDERTELIERLKELGHTPQGEGEPKKGEPETGEPEEKAEADLTQFSEEDLVTASYDQLRSLATQFEDIDGRWGKDKLEESLILKRREQDE